jgi:alpha-ketoglutarate-dependent taurine dioxygenase
MPYIGWYIRNAQRFADVPRLTVPQREALELIDSIANQSDFHFDMDFEPGDMQFLKNAVILHARTAYEDWEDRQESDTYCVCG